MAEFEVDDQDVLYNIFLKLPTKSILRFKCLSKYWNSMFCDPGYINLRSRRMILLPSEQLYGLDMNDVDKSIIKVGFPLLENYPETKEYIVVGTYNGIVVLAHRHNANVILYNPYTREFKIIPVKKGKLQTVAYPGNRFRPPRPQRFTTTYYAYGLGYATTTPDDLKLVRIRFYKDGLYRYIWWDVLSIKNKSWTEPLELDQQSLLDFNYKNFQDTGTFVNGFLYWSVHAMGFGRIILAFDIKDMVFSELTELPFMSRQCPSVTLGTFKGRLCMVCANGANCEVWQLMEDGGDKIPWEKMYRITLFSRANCLHGFDPVYIMDEGKIVMFRKPSEVLIYDMMNGSYKIVFTLASIGDLSKSQVVEYVETLVSPSDLCPVIDDVIPEDDDIVENDHDNEDLIIPNWLIDDG